MATQKTKEPFFSQMVFDDVRYASEVLTKEEARLKRNKIGLLIALVAQVSWLVLNFVSTTDLYVLEYIMLGVSLIITVAAYIVGGGLAIALKGTFKVAKTLFWVGWFFVPFPYDILTGIALSVVAIVVIPVLFLLFPIVLVLLSFIQTKKNIANARNYLSYCAMAQAAPNTIDYNNQ